MLFYLDGVFEVGFRKSKYRKSDQSYRKPALSKVDFG